MQAGATVALVTDAGMPAVSDPGADLVAAAVAAGIVVTVVPGPTAATAALAAAGCPAVVGCSRGSCRARESARTERLAELAAETADRRALRGAAPRRPHGRRPRGRCCGPTGRWSSPGSSPSCTRSSSGAPWRRPATWLADHEPRGEFVIVLGGGEPPPEATDDDLRRPRSTPAGPAGRRPGTPSPTSSTGLGVSKRRVYDLATDP